jgi:hypothetical protein
VKEILNQSVTVAQGGEKQSLTALELALKALIVRVGKGDPKAIDVLLKLAREYLPFADEPDYPTITLTPQVRNSIEFFEKIARDLENDESE